jgi:hypothetical protein
MERDDVEPDEGGVHAAEDDKAGRWKGVECAARDDGVERCAERGVGHECEWHFIEESVGGREAAEVGIGGE